MDGPSWLDGPVSISCTISASNLELPSELGLCVGVGTVVKLRWLVFVEVVREGKERRVVLGRAVY